MSVVCDFSKVFTMSGYREIVDKEMSHLDIGILCLNAGISTGAAPFHMREDSDIEGIMRVNALHVCYLAKIFLEKMHKREKRSAIIITSSGM